MVWSRGLRDASRCIGVWQKAGGAMSEGRGQLKSCGSTVDSHHAAWPEQPGKLVPITACVI